MNNMIRMRVNKDANRIAIHEDSLMVVMMNTSICCSKHISELVMNSDKVEV